MEWWGQAPSVTIEHPMADEGGRLTQARRCKTCHLRPCTPHLLGAPRVRDVDVAVATLTRQRRLADAAVRKDWTDAGWASRRNNSRSPEDSRARLLERK
jgi:hypothetical protein